MRQRNHANVLCAYCYGWTRNLRAVPFVLNVDGVESQVHLHERCVVPAKENGFTHGTDRFEFDEVVCAFVPVGPVKVRR